MSKSVVWSVFLVLVCAASVAGQSKVTFDNQSGEPALVRLIGPTQTEVPVPNGAKAGTDAAAGRYIIKVRYGVPGQYHYSKGQEFEVKETPTARSETTITLHKVVAGNYDSWSISAEEFGGTNATKAASARAANVLNAQYGSMTKPESQNFSSSIAFWPDDTSLVLLFRNYQAPVSEYKTPPPPGKVSLVVWIRKGHTVGGFSEVTAGTYNPGILEPGIIYPPGTTVLEDKAGTRFGLGTIWRINEHGEVKLDLCRDVDKMSIQQIRQLLQNIGSIALTQVGRSAGLRIKGEIQLGDGKKSNLTTGTFDVPVVEKPKDF